MEKGEVQALRVEGADGLSKTSAHTIGHDPWEQVGALLVTVFNCGYILAFSNLMLVPLGWWWGLPTLLIFAAFTAYSNFLLARFHFINGRRFIRYRDLMGFLFGKGMYHMTWVFQYLTILLSNMVFILMGGRSLKEIDSGFRDTPMRLQYYIIITGFTYFLFAFAVPTMSAMRRWIGISAILTSAYVIPTLVVLIKDGASNSNRSYNIRGSEWDKILGGFAAVSAIIVCNTSGMLIEIQSTLKRPAVKNMKKALLLQYSIGLLVYYGVSIAGYWAYGSAVSTYLPSDLSGPKWVKVIVNSTVFLQSIISQHMFLSPIHESLDTAFLKLEKGTYSRENNIRRFCLRSLLFSINTVVAAALPFSGDFVNLLGSFTLIPLTFIFPSMVFIKVEGKVASLREMVWHWSIVVLSSIITVVTTISAVNLIVRDVGTYHFFADT